MLEENSNRAQIESEKQNESKEHMESKLEDVNKTVIDNKEQIENEKETNEQNENEEPGEVNKHYIESKEVNKNKEVSEDKNDNGSIGQLEKREHNGTENLNEGNDHNDNKDVSQNQEVNKNKEGNEIKEINVSKEETESKEQCETAEVKNAKNHTETKEGNNNKDIVHPDVVKKLEQFLDSNGITNYAVDITQGTVKGDNYIGIIAKVKIDGTSKDGKTIQLNWIVKSAPQVELHRQLMHIEKVYSREIYVYEELFPLFKEFQIEKGIIDRFGVTASYVLSCLEQFKESLVMEDMKALGYVMRSRREPLDFDHVRLVMKAYGKLHAISFALRDQRPEVFKKIADSTAEQFFTLNSKEELAKGQDAFHKKAAVALDPVRDTNAINTYARYAEKSAYIFLDTIDVAAQDPHAVVGHGDCWINNMLFKYDDSKNPKSPSKVCLLDWQLIRFGSPVFDLSYFIFACTNKSLRDKHYDQIIKIYYYSLCSHLVELGSDPEKLFPFEALQAHLKRYSIFGLYLSTMVLHVMLSEADEIPEWDDNKTMDEIMDAYNYESKNQDHYNERVGGNIVDFYEKGYFDFIK